MITKKNILFEHKKKEIRDECVEKRIQEQYQEWESVKVPVPITRTRRIHHGPTGCGTCLRCGTRLRDDMWKYRKAKECYLCPNCWDSLSDSKRDEYRRKALIGYDSTENYIDYDYQDNWELITKTRERVIKEHIQNEYEVTDKIIEYPHHARNIPYPEGNKVIINDEIRIRDLLREWDKDTLKDEHFITDEHVSKDKYWYGARSIREAFSFLKKGGNIPTIDYQFLDTIEINDNSFDTSQVLEEFLDVVGFYPNVPAYLQGHPLNMYNNKRVNELSTTVYCNLALDSICSVEQYETRGKIVFSLLMYLIEVIGAKVNLVLLDATFIKGETFIQTIPIPYRYIMENKNKVYNVLIYAAFYRIILLDIKLKKIKDKQLSQEWIDGKGYVLRRKDLYRLLERRRAFGYIKPILFSDPIEDHIKGHDLTDDLIASTQRAIPQNRRPYRRPNPTFPIDIEALKSFIQEHEIEKLIHVTNIDNLDNIREYGIRPNSFLDKENVLYKSNDSIRSENESDALCLYITTPDVVAYRKYWKSLGKREEYVILEIKPEILWKLTSNNQPVQRTYYDINYDSVFASSSENDISIMFRDFIEKGSKHYEREGKRQINQPTSLKAEILFYGTIPTEYIMNLSTPTPLKL